VPEGPSVTSNLLQRFLDELERDRDGRLNVDEAARRLRVSPSHLSRVVRLASGRSPSEHIRMAKLGRARDRLATVSVTDAAMGCGFGKVSSFIALFRRYYGETPGEYKRRIARPAHGGHDQISGIPATKLAIGIAMKAVF
jgi:AraC-like DNA-binding protein